MRWSITNNLTGIPLDRNYAYFIKSDVANSHFIEPLCENPTYNNPHNRYEARGRFFLLMTSNTFVSEML